MRTMPRIYVAMLITLIALGTTFHATAATTMSFEMAMADPQNSDGDGCTACPDGDRAAPMCDLVCTMTFVAVPVSFVIQPIPVSGEFHSFSDRDPPSRFRSPDPTPPRTFIHS